MVNKFDNCKWAAVSSKVDFFVAKGTCNRKGFTVVELLVVIFILVILTGLLVPVFANAKKNAKRTSCAANLGQIGKATLMYMADADDEFPRGRNPWDVNPSPPYTAYPEFAAILREIQDIREILSPYTGGSNLLFRCPADNGTQALERLFPWPFLTTPSTYEALGTSYNYAAAPFLLELKIGNLEDPSQLYLFKTVAGHWHGTEGPLIPTDDDATLYRKQMGLRYNYLYADGHVEFVNFAQALKNADWSRFTNN